VEVAIMMIKISDARIGVSYLDVGARWSALPPVAKREANLLEYPFFSKREIKTAAKS
jgi:hypothetical protein